MALVVSFEHLANVNSNFKAKVLADSLDLAIENILKQGKSPGRKVGDIDNRGSHFFLAMYWAEELAKQDVDNTLKVYFSDIVIRIRNSKDKILEELNNTPVIDIRGYYYPEIESLYAAMRPSQTFNEIIDSI